MDNSENDYDNKSEESLKIFLKNLENELITETDTLISVELNDQYKYIMFFYDNWVYVIILILLLIIVIKMIRSYIKKD